MDKEKNYYVYWDASAILSALVKDSHSGVALKWIRKDGLHLLSTLAYAEVISVLDRMEKERILTGVLVQSALQALLEGPWRFLNLSPGREHMDFLRGKYLLRGADFWHLALAITLKKDIPELMVLTFDKKLREGTEKEGFACPS
jgi:predicted nucleic acid-binding protein